MQFNKKSCPLDTNVYNSHSFPLFTLGLTRDQVALCLGAQTPEPQCLDLNPSSPTYQLCDLNFIAPYLSVNWGHWQYLTCRVVMRSKGAITCKLLRTVPFTTNTVLVFFKQTNKQASNFTPLPWLGQLSLLWAPISQRTPAPLHSSCTKLSI